MIYLQLFYEFFKAGLFAIGGGLATLPFLSAMTERYDWFTKANLADMIAISESTPGPIGVNMSTYAGYHAAGILGSVVATASLVLPSVIVVVLVAKFLKKFQTNPLVQSAFYGIRPAVTGLIAAAGFQVMQISILQWEIFTQKLDITQLFDYKALALFVLLYLLIEKMKKVHPVVFIAGAAVIGIIFQF